MEKFYTKECPCGCGNYMVIPVAQCQSCSMDKEKAEEYVAKLNLFTIDRSLELAQLGATVALIALKLPDTHPLQSLFSDVMRLTNAEIDIYLKYPNHEDIEERHLAMAKTTKELINRNAPDV